MGYRIQGKKNFFKICKIGGAAGGSFLKILKSNRPVEKPVARRFIGLRAWAGAGKTRDAGGESPSSLSWSLSSYFLNSKCIYVYVCIRVTPTRTGWMTGSRNSSPPPRSFFGQGNGFFFLFGRKKKERFFLGDAWIMQWCFNFLQKG